MCRTHTTRKGSNSLRRAAETVYFMVRSVDYQIVDTDSAKSASQADWLQMNHCETLVLGVFPRN